MGREAKAQADGAGSKLIGKCRMVLGYMIFSVVFWVFCYYIGTATE